MIVSLIYAQSENGVIGKNNQLPWHLPADLQHFKKLTTGHTIVMGRKTYESIGRPLPNRRSIVVSRSGLAASGIEVVTSVDDALNACLEEDEVFVIGGANLFHAVFPKADRVYRTMVHADIPGDITLPPLDDSVWTMVGSETREPDEKNPLRLTFERFVRRSV